MFSRFLLVFLFVGGLAFDAFSDGVYTVKNISVEGVGVSATEARKIAVSEGESKAYYILLKRITPDFVHHAFPEKEMEEISVMVKGMNVRNEKISKTHYRAIIDISFNPQFVKKSLREAGVVYTESKSRPTLVLPLAHIGEEIVFAGEAGSWYEAWNSVKDRDGFVSFVVPAYDSVEVRSLDLKQIVAADFNLNKNPDLISLRNRYRADEVLVVKAQYDPISFESVNVDFSLYGKKGVYRKPKAFMGGVR